MLNQLSFRQPFRKYQRMILEQIVVQQKDHKYHLVAPPGAGKTIIGLELIRQFDQPAVVFAPTTTIQAQWYEKVGMFLDPAQADVSQFASMEADRHASINIFTYQLISTPTQAREHLKEAALLLWKESLVQDGQVPDLPAAQSRLDALAQNNPKEYQKEVLHFAGRVKKKLLSEPDADIVRFLHPNAVKLIDDLVAYGVRTVVLDECHHLLDYWAIVLRYLIARIKEPRVIGLTATLPSPETDAEYENYTSLLGEVDFEIPTPAVVKEGDLAPYRDLAYFVHPTDRENGYLKRIQTEFQDAIHSLTGDPHFRNWVRGLVLVPEDATDPKSVWQGHWDERPLLTLAAVRFLIANQVSFPKNFPIPVEATDPIEMEDWLNLLERYGLDILKTSADEKHHEVLRQLRKVLLPFGLTLTERGMNQSRSPGDLVMTFSESKDQAVAEILEAESKAMGDQLRAIVVTDYERVGTGVPQLKGVLDADAGSAVRTFRLLSSHAEVRRLNPVLITGKLLMIPASAQMSLLGEFKSYIEQNKLKATCALKPNKNEAIVEVIGEGRDWSPRTYVRMLTSLFDRGVVQCMVGTRGIFGEGWDSLSLNTLIDLTSVTTSASVQQLRGRTIRLDPNWKRKVAHNWDVICVAKDFEQGDLDFKRFIKRHKQYWGVVVYTNWEEKIEQALGAIAPVPPIQPLESAPEAEFKLKKAHGRIVKSIFHVNPYLATGLLEHGSIKKINFDKHNRFMLQQVKYRDKVYELWGIGDEYSNFSYHATSLNVRDLKIRTAFTLQNTLKALSLHVLLAVLQTAFLLYVYSARFLVSMLASGSLDFVFISLFLMMILFAVVFVVNARQIILLLKKAFAEQIPDAILLDIARALVEALRTNNLISRNLNPDYVRVVETEKYAYDVMLDYASPEDATIFINAYEEIFESVVDQRYLIKRTEDRLPNLALRAFWLPLRIWVRETGMYPPAYHPVPKILATRKERVESFAKYWSKYVGGGEVVFTRSQMGRAILLAARAQRRPKVKQMAFEIWK
jgi:superfamily II DNA or RNA helicase